MSSLYERLGGEAAIDAAVKIFYDKVLADTRISHFFEGIPMEKLIGHQKMFLTVAFGGSNNYSGRGMAAAHKRLVDEMGLTDLKRMHIFNRNSICRNNACWSE